MKGSRLGLATGLVQSLVATLTAFAALLSWRGFSTDSSSYLRPLFLGAILVGVLGAGLRWLRVHGALVVLSQILLATALVNVFVTGSPIPLGERWTSLTAALADAAAATQDFAAPVPAHIATIAPLMVPLGMAFIVLVDVFAGTLGKVPLAGLPLLTVYAIPVGLLTNGVSWAVFTLLAAGYLLMLFLHEEEQVARWGRPIGVSAAAADPSGFGVRTGAIRGTAVGIGATATALALVLPAFIPTLRLGVLGFGAGPGDGDIHVANPIADLQRDLKREADIPLLRVTTDDPEPTYLRISVLTRFNGEQWSAGDRKVPTEQTASGRMPEPAGVSLGLARDNYHYALDISDRFVSTWLPTYVPTTSVTAAGDWRYDVATMDFLAADDDLDTRGLHYELDGSRLHLTPQALAAAPAASGSVRDDFTALPDLPDEVRQQAISVTAGQPTRFQEADALQDWFRRTGGFTYDIQAASGNGNDALVDFLDNKVGYCEQYASAMAVMARSIGLPARVAIGFLRPENVGDGVWEFSSHDLHAWVEIYFPGSGWVLFDPTPRSISAEPTYTRGQITKPGDTPSSQGPSGRGAADDPTSAGPSSTARRPERDTSGSAGDSGSGVPWLAVAGGLGGAALLGLALWAPSLLRRLRRERRWRSWPPPEAAWAELGDTLTDLGNPWPPGLSPRAAASHVRTFFGEPESDQSPERPRHGAGVNPEAEAALERILTAVELHRYAAPGRHTPAELVGDVETCTQALYGGAARASRRRARWFPLTVLRRPRRTPPPSTVEVVGQGGLVDHVG